MRPLRGQVVLITLIFLAVFATVVVALLASLTSYSRLEETETTKAQALALAEAGVDNAIYQLNQNPSYAGETDTTLVGGQFSVSVATIDGSTKQVTAIGYIPNSTSPLAERTIRAQVSTNSSTVSFRYGVQAGAGGFNLSGGSTINGNVYANGDIQATNGVHITGSAFAADPPAETADQVNNTPLPITSCSSTTCITFGNSNTNTSVAQSFKISSANSLNNIQFYIEKVGSPSDATVYIVNDNGGKPGTDTLMSATLPASSVTTSFGWVSVPLSSTPVLDPTQTYWVVIQGGSNGSKYYVIGANQGGYANGLAMQGKYGGTWSATSPAGLDAYFQLYLGGGTSYIGGSTNTTGVYIGSTASDTAAANTVEGATITGTLYCQTGSNTNEPCNTTQPDPSPQPMPASDGNIADWESEASTGGTITGNYTVGSSGATLGPEEITGNLTVGGGGTLTITGTLWVQGSLTVSGGGKVVLSPSYGAGSGVVVVSGPVTIEGGASFSGSGQQGSYPFVITTSACPAASGCNGSDAIYLSGGAGTVVMAAQNGAADIDGGGALQSVTAQQIIMSGGATLTYNSGLVSTNFTDGPGASWQFLPGTYVVSQ